MPLINSLDYNTHTPTCPLLDYWCLKICQSSHGIPVLGHSGMKAAHIMLSLVTKTVLSLDTTEHSFHKGLFYFHSAPLKPGSWEKPWLVELAQTGQRGIPFHRTFCSWYQLGKRRRAGWGGILVVKMWPCYFCCFPEDGWASACQWKWMNEFCIEFLLNSCDSEQATGWAVTYCPGSTQHSSLGTTGKKWTTWNLLRANVSHQ